MRVYASILHAEVCRACWARRKAPSSLAQTARNQTDDFSQMYMPEGLGINTHVRTYPTVATDMTKHADYVRRIQEFKQANEGILDKPLEEQLSECFVVHMCVCVCVCRARK